jgi:circadian clock protein KaiC
VIPKSEFRNPKWDKERSMTEIKPTAGTFWSGLPALDQDIIPNGIPLRSLNVIGGAPGTGKTILALQMLFANTSPDYRAIYFTTISEPTVKFLAYLQDFDFYDPKKMFSSIVVRDIGEAIQTQPLPQVIETINQAIKEENARLVVVDSFKAISDVVSQVDQLRVFAYDLAVNLVSSLCTAFLVGEYTPEDVAVVPVFAIADGIIFLSFEAQGLNRVRFLDVHKIRGRRYFVGRHPFTISPAGLTIYPRITTPVMPRAYEVGREKLSTGVAGLDEMLQGGFPQGSITLIAGGAGVGKTLLSLHFAINGIGRGEPCLFVSFQETPSHLRALAEGFGWDLADLEAQGLLKLFYTSPVELIVDQHTAHIKQAIVELGARRVVIDGLKDIEMVTPNKLRFKDYTYSLANFFRAEGITALLTNEIPELFGTMTLSEHGVSFISDNVILLRYVELASQITRAISVLKMRGSNHDKSLREYRITLMGMEVLEPFEGVQGIITGTPTERRIRGELGRLEELAAKMGG